MADEAIYGAGADRATAAAFRRARVGAEGREVEYVFQLLRTNSPLPDDDFALWDNNHRRTTASCFEGLFDCFERGRKRGAQSCRSGACLLAASADGSITR